MRGSPEIDHSVLGLKMVGCLRGPVDAYLYETKIYKIVKDVGECSARVSRCTIQGRQGGIERRTAFVPPFPGILTLIVVQYALQKRNQILLKAQLESNWRYVTLFGDTAGWNSAELESGFFSLQILALVLRNTQRLHLTQMQISI